MSGVINVKRVEELPLAANESVALATLKSRLHSEFAIERLILFGSVVRGESDSESDIDLLVLTSQPMARRQRHEITDLVFQINLEFDTNFSTLVVDRHSWESGPFSILPIKERILADGALV